jgi:hypothetical protein
MDSEALFESGGMRLIKAIKDNIVSHERESSAPDHRAAPALSSAALSAAARAQQPSTIPESTYWRGASVPFEMVCFFQHMNIVLIVPSFCRLAFSFLGKFSDFLCFWRHRPKRKWPSASFYK